MDKQAFEKLERIVETVRRHLEGDAAVAFVHESGHRVTSQGMVRFFRSSRTRSRSCWTARTRPRGAARLAGSAS